MKDSTRKTPLHLAVEGASVHVVTALVGAHPRAAAVKDGRGWMPLHVAVAQSPPAEVVTGLLAAHPQAAALKDGEGWLPLEDFESALLLVLSPGADGQHDAQGGEHAQQAKQEDQVMMAAQVKDLVASLKRSHMVNPLKDLQSHEIDYNMFIQSFTVIDTLIDQP